MSSDGDRPTRLAAVAREATVRAGRLLRERFRTPVTAEYGTDDVTTAADRDAERLIRERILAAYPDHAVVGEEHGRTAGGPVEWLVDPLDGTNNYAVGHPTVAVAVSARCDGEALAAAIHEPLVAETLVAAAGRGTRRLTPDPRHGEERRRDGSAATAPDESVGTGDGGGDEPIGTRREPFDAGERVRASHDRPLAESTVSFVVGVAVVRDPDRRATAQRVRDRLGDRAKRTLETWAPCVDWGHLARGGTAGLVAFAPDDRETVPGRLIAERAGVAVESRGDWLLAAPDADRLPALRETLPDTASDSDTS